MDQNNKRKTLKRNIRTYNAVMSNVWLLITFIVIGFLVGFLLSRLFTSHRNIVIIVVAIIFSLLGVVNFFYRLIFDLRKLNVVEEEENKKLHLKPLEDDEEEED